MTSPLSHRTNEPLEVVLAKPGLGHWVRGTLVGIALGLCGVFAIAAWLNPYNAEGDARTSETHKQLGLPSCTFKTVTGLPCPSCGMTTSFSLLMHGDLANSLRANAVGTLLAIFCLLLIPWSVASAIRSEPLFIASMERALLWVIVVFLVLALARWSIVLLLALLNGTK
jgi:hypothetical protein